LYWYDKFVLVACFTTLWKAYQLPGGIWKLLLPGNVLQTSEGQGKVPRTMCLWNKECHMSGNWLTNWKQVVTCTCPITSGNVSTDRPCAEGLLRCYFVFSQIFRNGCTSLSKCPVTCQNYRCPKKIVPFFYFILFYFLFFFIYFILFYFLFFFLGAQCVESGVSCTDCY
jgi:hypothetical protein